MKNQIRKGRTLLESCHFSTLAFGILGILSLAIYFYPNPLEKKQNPGAEFAESVDTYIPRGYVLVPLELSNLESLNSFIGQGGIVDLYTTRVSGRGKKIASKIKIIRAPLNPNLFAALVPENASSTLLDFSEPLIAVVQNKNEKHGGLENQPKITPYKIFYRN